MENTEAYVHTVIHSTQMSGVYISAHTANAFTAVEPLPRAFGTQGLSVIVPGLGPDQRNLGIAK